MLWYKANMNLEQYMASLSIAEKEEFALRCDSSVAYLRLIARGIRKVKVGEGHLGMRICIESGWTVLPYDLRPDIYTRPLEGLPPQVHAEMARA